MLVPTGERTDDRVIRKPTVLVASEARKLVFPHPDLGDGQHAAQGEDVCQMALALLGRAQVQARGAAVHKVLIAAAQRARQRDQAQTAKSVQVRQVAEGFRKHIYR